MPLAPIETLISPRLTLRSATRADLPDLLQVNGDPEVTRFLPHAPWRSVDDGLAWLQRMAAMRAEGSGQLLVVVTRSDDRAVGTVQLFRHDDASARAELGYVLGRAHWRQGLMREAVHMLCDHAYSTLGLRRLEAQVNTANEPSNAFLRDLGFVHEGTLRERSVVQGVAHDVHLHGCLARDWAARSSG